MVVTETETAADGMDSGSNKASLCFEIKASGFKSPFGTPFQTQSSLSLPPPRPPSIFHIPNKISLFPPLSI